MGLLRGMILIRAGRSVMEYRRANMTPAEANMPRSAMGTISAVEKESKPPAVVRLVRRIGSPECPRAYSMAEPLSPVFLNS